MGLMVDRSQSQGQGAHKTKRAQTTQKNGWALRASKAVHALPLRDGVGASTRVLPSLHELTFSPTSLLSFLEHATQNSQKIDWQSRLEKGMVCDAQGQSLPRDTPYLPGMRIYYWRDAGFEPRIAFDERIIYQDAHLLVADKPHFLPVTPTGRYVKETLLVRLKQRTGLPDLTPMHRIDRDTAGLVMFCIRAQDRNRYAQIFREQGVRKIYECIAPFSQAMAFPRVHTSRLETSPQTFMQMVETAGMPNTETHIALLERLPPPHADWARYRLQPVSGKRHQLRVHMNALGLPIRGDGIYPRLSPETAQPDHAQPLQLLAQALAFRDPVTGLAHQFQSQLHLKLHLD
jgi:tRNA pseudouridine32 synthase / 23S rRNA pseudouridine746 synthase